MARIPVATFKLINSAKETTMRANSLVVVVLAFVLSDCASSDLRGSFVEPANARSTSVSNAKVVIVFVDKAVFTPGSLSSLRIGMPATTVGNGALEDAFRRISRHIEKVAPDSGVQPMLQSSMKSSSLTGATHTVLVSARKITSSMSTGMMSDVDVVIRDEVASRPIWKGEIVVTSDYRNSEKVASELLRILREVGLRPRT